MKYDITVTEVRSDDSEWEPDVPTGKVYSDADMNRMAIAAGGWCLLLGIIIGAVWL